MKKIPNLDEYEWQKAVLGILPEPPISPAKGDRYIIEDGTGVWSGKDGQIATYILDWDYIPPKNGMFVWLGSKLLTYRDGWAEYKTKTEIVEAIGDIDDENLFFEFETKPTIININGANYRENHGWTWDGIATLAFPVGTGGDIYGIL